MIDVVYILTRHIDYSPCERLSVHRGFAGAVAAADLYMKGRGKHARWTCEEMLSPHVNQRGYARWVDSGGSLEIEEEEVNP